MVLATFLTVIFIETNICFIRSDKMTVKRNSILFLPVYLGKVATAETTLGIKHPDHQRPYISYPVGLLPMVQTAGVLHRGAHGPVSFPATAIYRHKKFRFVNLLDSCRELGEHFFPILALLLQTKSQQTKIISHTIMIPFAGNIRPFDNNSMKESELRKGEAILHETYIYLKG